MNKIENINKNAFGGLNNLKYLNLAYCQIDTIEKDAFEHMEKLQYLDLSNNQFLSDLKKKDLLLNQKVLNHLPDIVLDENGSCI